jgi:AcrR family transcriptional regulator
MNSSRSTKRSPRGSDAPTHRGPRDERGVIAARILSAARASFAAHGYASTSLRAVAREADVDPALIGYYFGSKRGLFETALVPPADWTAAIAAAAASPIRRRGEALVRTMINAWEDPATEGFLRSAILTAAHEPVALERLAANFAVHILDAVSSKLPDQERFLRASLASSQLVGLAMTRYIWKVGALAGLPATAVVDLIAPTIQRYLTGELPSRSADSQLNRV